MSKDRHQQQQVKGKVGQQQKGFSGQEPSVKAEAGASMSKPEWQQGQWQQGSTVNMTPGRAPAEGPDEESAMATPSHERWEQDTADRDPAEGGEMEAASPTRSKKR